MPTPPDTLSYYLGVWTILILNLNIMNNKFLINNLNFLLSFNKIPGSIFNKIINILLIDFNYLILDLRSSLNSLTLITLKLNSTSLPL